MKLKYIVLTVALVLFSLVASAEPLDINTATVEQLEALQNIGPTKAAAIIAYREEHGPFQSVDDLIKVKGIGEKTLEDIKAHVSVSDASEPEGSATAETEETAAPAQ